MIDLKEHEQKIWSQKGEDGVIKKIFETLGIEKGHAVELGAWDGIKYSNVYNLIRKGWSATLIEGDAKKYKILCKNMREYPLVTPVLKMVSLRCDNNLSDILESFNVSGDFDILSLDLDGCDYWIWRDLRFNPKLVVVEYNSNWEKSVTVPYREKHHWDGTQYYGASATAFVKLAKSRGYDWVAHTPYANLFFLKTELNKREFKTLTLESGFHILKNHHKPMNKKQIDSLIYDPPI